MSTTPRTDEEVYEEDTGLNGMVKVIHPDFARQLECELSLAQARVKELEADLLNERSIKIFYQGAVVESRSCIEQAFAELQASAAALKATLRQISCCGGRILRGNPFDVHCTGSWCAEQARAALYALRESKTTPVSSQTAAEGSEKGGAS